MSLVGRRFDCPLVLDRTSLVYARTCGHVQREIVVVLRILYAVPANVHPLSLVFEFGDTSIDSHVVVELVLYVADLKFLQHVV